MTNGKKAYNTNTLTVDEEKNMEGIFMPLEQEFEDVAPNGNILKINRNIRCKNCNGCLVTEIDGEGTFPNMVYEDYNYVCLDGDECEANVKASLTNVKLHLAQSMNDGKVEICGYTIESPSGEITVEKV